MFILKFKNFFVTLRGRPEAAGARAPRLLYLESCRSSLVGACGAQLPVQSMNSTSSYTWGGTILGLVA